MEIEMRLLEEWKANHDLLKFYEDLKQKRFAHFLTIQTAFLAFFALLAKDTLATVSLAANKLTDDSTARSCRCRHVIVAGYGRTARSMRHARWCCWLAAVLGECSRSG
jgi:hypothetical protein